MKNCTKKIQTIAFISIESFLFYLIMTKGGNILILSSFISILFCFLFLVINYKNADKYIFFALLFTSIADYFLVVASPVQRVYGMMFFSVAQTLYALMLHKKSKSARLILSRILFVLSAEVICVFILKKNTDILAIFSIYYYSNLIFSIIHSFIIPKKEPIFSIGFIFLLLCDTVIGLQVASNGYLPIKEGTFIYNIIFTDFFLSWFFYLPSQVLISLSGSKVFKS